MTIAVQPDAFYCIDALSGLALMPDDSVDLAVCSPPYANIRNSYAGTKASDYVAWFLPIAKEILRVLKPTGSFILNIDDKCEEGERIPYSFEIVIELRKLGFKFIDDIIWAKKNGAPKGARRRSNYFEHIFHFAKTVDYKWLVDEIRTPYSPASIKRAQKPIKQNVSNREGRVTTTYKKWNLHERGAWPTNIIYFPKDNGKTAHVAPFHPDLPKHFILAHSEPGDLILDPFAGRGTTLSVAQSLQRHYIGFDIKPEYVKLGEELYGLNGVLPSIPSQ